MAKDLSEASSTEEAAVKDFDGLSAAKEKQINALTKEIEDKIARVGDGGVEFAGMKEDLEDTTKSLAEDKNPRLILRRTVPPRKMKRLTTIMRSNTRMRRTCTSRMILTCRW